MQSENKTFDDLMIDYYSGVISESDQKRLSELLKSSVELRLQFSEMLKLHAIAFTPQIEAEKQANYQKLIAQIKDQPVIVTSRFQISDFRKIAANIVLFISLSVASFYIYRDITSPADTMLWYETFSPVGSQTKIILPDSTVVWLNSGSTLKYNKSFGIKSREVALAGEGYFEVKKDKTKPFTVHTDSLNVNVLGTVFNVRAYTEDATVIVNLMEGSVNISLPKATNDGSLIMKPNERLVFNKQTKKSISSETDASRSALWTTGKLCFVDATLEQITKDLERKYDVKIQIASEKTKNEIFSGSLNLSLPLKEVLNYIDVDKKFIIKQSGDTINISVKQLK
jgi:transmembrane sensor